MAYIDKYRVEYSDDKKTLIRCPENFKGDYSIEDGVTEIGGNAFCGCKGLTSIEIPSTVTEIAWGQCQNEGAFNGCTGLTTVNIEIPGSVMEMGYRAFEGCTSLTSIVIPNSVREIEWHAFYHCTGLTSFTIPNSAKEIGWFAFEGCTKLSEIHIHHEHPEKEFVSDFSFGDVAANCTLYVPIGTGYA